LPSATGGGFGTGGAGLGAGRPQAHAATRVWAILLAGAASGRVAGAPGATWRAIDKALRRGHVAGVGGASTLAQRLARRRGRRNPGDVPRLALKQILEWADRNRRRTGRWPVHASGAVTGAPGETWANVDEALRVGRRGLSGGSSLVRLLAAYRRVRKPA
jgi:hypothetical protein